MKPATKQLNSQRAVCDCFCHHQPAYNICALINDPIQSEHPVCSVWVFVRVCVCVYEDIEREKRERKHIYLPLLNLTIVSRNVGTINSVCGSIQNIKTSLSFLPIRIGCLWEEKDSSNVMKVKLRSDKLKALLARMPENSNDGRCQIMYIQQVNVCSNLLKCT